MLAEMKHRKSQRFVWCHARHHWWRRGSDGLRRSLYITNGVSRLQTNDSNSTCRPYCHGHTLEFIPIKPLVARACGAPGSGAGHSRSPSRDRARLPPTDRHACVKQQGRGAAPCGSWGWTDQRCADRLARSPGVRCAVDTSHTTPRSQGREQSENRPDF
jgi:hypothetical protein